MATATVRITVALPPDLEQRIKATLKPGELNAFMVQAAQEKLEREAQ